MVQYTNKNLKVLSVNNITIKTNNELHIMGR